MGDAHMLSAPSEVSIAGVYFPPLFLSSGLGLLITYLVVKILTRFRLSRYFVSPPLVFLSLAVIFSGLIETFFIVG
jgi:hypothetical protein